MKADFSRRTFDPANHYSAVLQEQGRMLTDADLDEEHRIVAHRVETEAADLIGGCGGPIGAAGFAITPSGTQVAIGAGRYYVDGILVDNEVAVQFTEQPDRPGVEWPGTTIAGRYLAYLDVWRRLITALDEPDIREVALGGPTTSARERTVWQVRLAQVGATDTCLSPLPDLGGTTGRLAAQADPEAAEVDPCEVPPSAGFKGLENQFYRVEVHDPGDAYDVAAGADVFVVDSIPTGTTDQVTLADTTGLSVGDAVEIYRSGAGHDPLEGQLAHVTDITGLTVTLDVDLDGFALDDAPRLRRVDATFLWSRDNGSVVTAIERIDGVEITVHDLGPDDVLGFAPGQWVEITDDRNELEMQPGQLLVIDSIDTVRRMVLLKTPANPLATPLDGTGIDAALHPRLRRWDGAGGIRRNNPVPGSDWIHLEDGVQVRFDAGRYRTGDYWHFPARTATADPASGNIEWPQDPVAGEAALVAPHGVVHHYCRLAMLELVDAAVGGVVLGPTISDCRNEFPPVTELTTLLYVGGDGQEGLPDPANPASRSVELPGPLQVRVANGSFPVMGARVRFTITAASNGRLQGTNSKTAVVETVPAADGIASCEWHLDGNTPHQVCEARLLDAAGNELAHQVVRFQATLSTAARVAYNPQNCPDLLAAGVRTVQEAIDALCGRGDGDGGRCCCVVVGEGGDFPNIETAIRVLLEQGRHHICLCLVPGDHVSTGMTITPPEPDRLTHVRITGCGPATRLHLQDDLRAFGLGSFAVHGLQIGIRQGATIHTIGCHEVTFDECLVSGLPRQVGLVRIHQSARVRVADSTFESFLAGEPDGDMPGEVRALIDEIQGRLGIELFVPWLDFTDKARIVGADLAGRTSGELAGISDEVSDRLTAAMGILSLGEARSIRRLIDALRSPGIAPALLYDHLVAIRRNVLRVEPGIALEFDSFARLDQVVLDGSRAHDGPVIIENNDICGVVSFYGPSSIARDFTLARLRRLRGLLEEGQIELGGLDAAVHIRDNRLTRIAISDVMTDALEALSNDDNADLRLLLSSVHCTDNVIDGARSEIATYQATLTSNEFSLTAVRGGGPGAQLSLRIADVVADAAIYTGNHGASRGFDVTFQAQVANVARAETEAANLEIQFLF